MRFNAHGMAVLHVPYTVVMHARSTTPRAELAERARKALLECRTVEALIELLDSESENDWPTVIERAMLEGLEALPARVELGDPADCDCSTCRRLEKSRCRHEPDYATVRSCSSTDLGCEVQCALCKQWGAFCVDEKSVGWADSGGWSDDVREAIPGFPCPICFKGTACYKGQSRDLVCSNGECAHVWISRERKPVSITEPSIQTCACCNLVQPYTNTLCTDCGHDLCDPEGCECGACKIAKAGEGRALPPT